MGRVPDPWRADEAASPGGISEGHRAKTCAFSVLATGNLSTQNKSGFPTKSDIQLQRVLCIVDERSLKTLIARDNFGALTAGPVSLFAVG